jgi:transposase
VYTNMELWSEVPRRVLTGELSKCQACKEYKLHWDTLAKILGHEEPPGYRRKAPRKKPVLGPFVALIHEILQADKKAPPKQRHTAKRILQRLRKEGYQGGRTVVQEEVRRQRQRSAEVFMPLVHRPGEAQADFGEATVVHRGQTRKAAMFVMSVLGSERLTGATLDRLTHRCHILEATGESYRLQDARRRRGVGRKSK